MRGYDSLLSIKAQLCTRSDCKMFFDHEGLHTSQKNSSDGQFRRTEGQFRGAEEQKNRRTEGQFRWTEGQFRCLCMPVIIPKSNGSFPPQTLNPAYSNSAIVAMEWYVEKRGVCGESQRGTVEAVG